MRFVPDFAAVKLRYCLKPHCDRHMLARHHVKMESLWLHLGNQLITLPEKKGWTFQKINEIERRYHEFRPEDVRLICNWHHGEIHLLYDIELDKWIKKLNNKPLNKYSWTEAQNLMTRFEKVFNIWIKKVTPGVDPKFLTPFKHYPLLKAEMVKE